MQRVCQYRHAGSINEQLAILGASPVSEIRSIMVDAEHGLVITDDKYRATSTPSVSVVEIATATTTAKTAFVVNQLGDGDVVDFQADGVSIVNIANEGKVSIIAFFLRLLFKISEKQIMALLLSTLSLISFIISNVFVTASFLSS